MRTLPYGFRAPFVATKRVRGAPKQRHAEGRGRAGRDGGAWGAVFLKTSAQTEWLGCFQNSPDILVCTDCLVFWIVISGPSGCPAAMSSPSPLRCRLVAARRLGPSGSLAAMSSPLPPSVAASLPPVVWACASGPTPCGCHRRAVVVAAPSPRRRRLQPRGPLAWHCFALLCIALLCSASQCHCVAMRCFALFRIYLHYVALRCIALHWFATLCITLLCHCFNLQSCCALHCITLQAGMGVTATRGCAWRMRKSGGCRMGGSVLV
eukprot:9244973-Pyramimonas_sp.AAC.1